MFATRVTNTVPGLHRRLAQSALHLTILGCAITLWAWHLGSVAAQQPIANKWGWFFNYMTFWTLSLQLLQFLVSLPVDLFPGVLASWRNVVDDFACAIFPPVLFVSFSYYLILYLPLEALYGDNYQVVREEQEWDGGLQRLAYQSGARVPAWVPSSLHIGNSLAAILDLFVCIEQRTFSKRAERTKSIICFSYSLWLLLCRCVTGTFPYPFMQDLPLLWGFGFALLFMVTSCELIFGMGRQIHAISMGQQQRQPAAAGTFRSHQR